MYDSQCKEAVRKNVNMLVPWYLMCAFAYYKMDDPIVTDDTFDMLGRMLHDAWDQVEHMHKDLITKGDLKAGTYLGEYPSRLYGAIQSLKGESVVKHKQETKPDESSN